MKSVCWDTRATDSIIKSGKKDTEASILLNIFCILRLLTHLGFFSKTGSDTFGSVLT